MRWAACMAIRHARGTENPLRVMLDAHMDEVGLLIVSDEDGGLFRFIKVGGIDDRILPGKMVLVGKENLPGVIGAKAIHLTEPGETDNKIPVDALRIDIGPGGGKVKVGDRATFATRFQEVGPSFIAKALDNRLGCATLIEILRAAAQGRCAGSPRAAVRLLGAGGDRRTRRAGGGLSLWTPSWPLRSTRPRPTICRSMIDS